MADVRRSPRPPAPRVLAIPLLAALVLLAACGRREPALKHVIFFIGDGMSASTEVAASRYLYGRDDGLAWHKLPAKAFVATWDVNVYNANARLAGRPPFARSSFTPASRLRREGGRAATAPGAGRRASLSARPGDRFGLGGDGPGHRIQDRLRQHRLAPRRSPVRGAPHDRRGAPGRPRGVRSASSAPVPFNHATPAAFVSHNTSRSAYYTGYRGYKGLGLAEEIIFRTKPEVVIGGGHPLFDNPGFDPKKGYISRSLYLSLQASTEYLLVERRAGQDGGRAIAEGAAAAAREGRKLFGLFGGKGGSFEVPLAEDRPGAPLVRPATEENPSLAEATLAALDFLGRDPDGFFLVVEQGDIDWANHDNDFRAMIGSVADLDGAVRAALAFVDRPGDALDWTNTVLLVTADHATGGLWFEAGRSLGAGDLPLQEERLAQAAGERPGDRARTARRSNRPSTPRPTSTRTTKSPTGPPGTPTSWSTWPRRAPRPALSWDTAGPGTRASSSTTPRSTPPCARALGLPSR